MIVLCIKIRFLLKKLELLGHKIKERLENLQNDKIGDGDEIGGIQEKWAELNQVLLSAAASDLFLVSTFDTAIASSHLKIRS